MANYEAVIGLETHIQLNTQSKSFCSCRADSRGAEPNMGVFPMSRLSVTISPLSRSRASVSPGRSGGSREAVGPWTPPLIGEA
jgi:Glu-tRNA(Gln) amidotransferase subunit E-like FAD-binding protein